MTKSKQENLNKKCPYRDHPFRDVGLKKLYSRHMNGHLVVKIIN